MSGIVGKNLGRGSGVIAATPVGADAVSGSNVADDAIGSEHIVDNAVGLAALAGGTDGQIISWDASGDPVALGPGTDGQVLTSTGAGSPPAFEAVSAGVTDMHMTTQFSRDMTAASGTQDITGFGFDPTHIILYIAIEGAVGCCFGHFGNGNERSFSTTEANNQHLSGGTIIRLYTNYSGTNQHGDVSFITDGFRITWAKNGSPTGTAYGWSTGWRAV